MAEAGLLDGHFDLRAVSLALKVDSTPLRRAAALAALADDSRAVSSLHSLYSTREHSSSPLRLTSSSSSAAQPGFSQHAFPLASIWPKSAPSNSSVANSLLQVSISQPHMSPATARAARDITRGDLCLVVPHLRIPWAIDLAKVLWRVLGVRLERRGPTTIPSPDFGAILVALGDVVPDVHSVASGSTLAQTRRHEVFLSDKFGDVAHQFYPPLSPDDHDYNTLMSLHLHRSRGPHAVAKLANLVRLSYVNSVLSDIRRQIVKASTDLQGLLVNIETAKQQRSHLSRLEQVDSEPELPTKKRASSIGDSMFGKDSVPACSSGENRPLGRRRRPRGSLVVAAVPVKGDCNVLSPGPAKYLLHGSLVPANLLSTVCDVLAHDFHIHVSLACDAVPFNRVSPYSSFKYPACPLPALKRSSVPSPMNSISSFDGSSSTQLQSFARGSRDANKQRVASDCRLFSQDPETFLDSYLFECFGLCWSAVCSHVLKVAEIRERNSNVEKLRISIDMSSKVEDDAQQLRAHFINSAVSYQLSDASLSQKCAIRLAQSLTRPDINALFSSLPREIWRLISSAKSQLEELENAEFLFLQSLNSL